MKTKKRISRKSNCEVQDFSELPEALIKRIQRQREMAAKSVDKELKSLLQTLMKKKQNSKAKVKLRPSKQS